jgi:hypothetical protein
MPQGYRFPYSSIDGTRATLMPRLPFTLRLQNNTVDVLGLVDSGSTVNVIPYSVGVLLGAIWENQQRSFALAGNLERSEARALPVQVFHPQLTGTYPVDLVFAWARSDTAPIIFGQANFLMEFRVCFDAQEEIFEVYPRTNSGGT